MSAFDLDEGPLAATGESHLIKDLGTRFRPIVGFFVSALCRANARVTVKLTRVTREFAATIPDNPGHELGTRVDLEVSWDGNLVVKDHEGRTLTITSEPRDITNEDVVKLAKTYGLLCSQHAGHFSPDEEFYRKNGL